jgi:hypothetical protein
MGLLVERASAHCGIPPTATAVPPTGAAQRLPDSQAVAGQRDIAWVWLGSPTRRYPHAAMGSLVHAGSLHVILKDGASNRATKVTQPKGLALSVELPLNRVFEDRVPRLFDLDGDGQDEILLVESEALRGSALVVYGVSPAEGQARARLVEKARGPFTGSTFRWLNPVGVADFNGDGRLDVASVTTPHIGGVLTLHHYQPPELVPYAKAMDVSNHRMGALEQQLAVIVTLPNLRPTVLVPDMTRRALHALRWDAPGQWHELADLMPLPAEIEKLTPLPDGACAALADGSFARVTLKP